MSNFSTEPSSVRVDLFREGGKWVDTIAVNYTKPDSWDMWTALKEDIRAQHPNYAAGNYWAVCLTPYAPKFEHPIMFHLQDR